MKKLLANLGHAVQQFAHFPHNVGMVRRHSHDIAQLENRRNILMCHSEIARIKSGLPNGRLERFGSKTFSEYDTDGIITEIFRRVGTTNKRFVEFGTGNGSENNTTNLLMQDWCGLWLEGNEKFVEAQRVNFKQAIVEGRLKTGCAFLNANNINQVIETAGLSGEIDLLSVDVDGNDYHLWKALTVVQPRVAVIEYNAFFVPPVKWVMAYNASHVWDGTLYMGASLSALDALASRKGFTLVGCNLVGLDAFFVRNDLATEFEDRGASNLFNPRRWWLSPAYQSETFPVERPHTVE